MTRSLRTALAVVGAAGLVGTAAATAAPSVPDLRPAPPFSIGERITPSWTDSTFTFLSRLNHYEVLVTDLTAGGPTFLGQSTQSLLLVGGRVNGRQYSVRVRSSEEPCTNVVLFPTLHCSAFGAAVTSAWSPAQLTRMDATAPTGSFTINGGAAFTRTREVTLTHTAVDPLSAGQPSSGVATHQVFLNNDGFTCELASSDPRCPQTLTPTEQVTLPEGPDGPRSVRVSYRDAARFYTPLFFDPTPGNQSESATASITLDTTAPVATVTQSATGVAPGTPVAFSASASTDATSGVDLAGAAWAFGDGTSATGPEVSKTYTAPGVFNGTLTIADRAGNTATKTFSVTVTAPTGGTTGTPTTKALLLGITRLDRPVQGKRLRVRVRMGGRASVQVRILRVGTGGTTRQVRRITKTGGPGYVVFTFTAPPRGTYRIEVRSAGTTRKMGLTVAAR